MLLARGAESARVDDLVAAARAGGGGVLVIRGEPGIGKSALLDYAREAARDLLILSARGVEAESELPFAALSDFVSPILDHLQAIPGLQRRALEAALGRAAPPVRDRFAVYAAALNLLAAAAERSPLLGVVDDAHWIDRPSAKALAFVGRRLGAEAVALLVAVREGERTPLDRYGLPELRLGGLGPEGCQMFLQSRVGEPVSATVADRLLRATRGNPLALSELAALLTPAQLAGHEPVDEPLPVGEVLGEQLRARITALPTETQRALVVAAANDSESVDDVVQAMRTLGMDAGALEPAEAGGILLATSSTLVFSHPMLRSAAYHSAPGPDRRAAHRALAGTVAGQRQLDRRAWHLAAATVGCDERTAEDLERTAADARARGAPGVAARAGQVAARLTRDDEQRARRLLQAGQDAYLAGDPEHSRGLLGEGALLADSPLLRAEIEHARGRVERSCCSVRRSR